MAEQSRQFHLGDILTVTTGKLVSPGHVAAVHELLNFMTGDMLMTHQLSRAMDECQPGLLRQHPDLADVRVPSGLNGHAEVLAWLATQTVVYGEYREVASLPPEDHTRINPLTELAMNYPHLKVVPVVVDDEGSGDG